MRIAKSGANWQNDAVKGMSRVNYGGALVVINAGGAAFAAGDTFTLFGAASYAGAFSTITLPALPVGLQWSTSNLAVNGSIAAVKAVVPLP